MRASAKAIDRGMSEAKPSPAGATAASKLFRLSVGVFFIGGFMSAAVSLLVARQRLFLGFDYAAATSIQLAFHSSYLLFALPIAAFIAAYGYMRGHAAGLVLIAVGTVMLVTGTMTNNYSLVLASLLTISAGATFLQIASNTAVTVVGDPARAAIRLNLLQGLNSFGTVIAPVVAAPFILGSDANGLAVPFGAAAVVLTILAVLFWRNRDLLGPVSQAASRASRSDWSAAVRDRRLLAGAGAIFVYVGAEVTIGSLLADYLMLPETLGLSSIPAGRLVALYWAGAMAGRFIGGALMQRLPAARLLAIAALTAAGLTGVGALGGGAGAAAALLAVGLCNSIMYPTIYVLALPAAPSQATPGATILCMAVVGGAVIPVLTGLIADAHGLPLALLLPAACYLLILHFARTVRLN